MTKPTNHDPDVTVIFDFADLAQRLGFDSDNIRNIKAVNPHLGTAREFLEKARP
jgi:hypothetical protein